MTTKSLFAGLALLTLTIPVLSVCTGSYTYTACPGDVVRYYDPNNGELYDFLDCGGGRAPPKTDVPGCPLYSGTSVRATTPSYLPCWTPPGGASTQPTPTTAPGTTSPGSSSPLTQPTPTTASETTSPSSSSSLTQPPPTLSGSERTSPPTTLAPVPSGSGSGTSATTGTTPTGAPAVTPNAAAHHVAGGMMAVVAGAAVALL